jgi:hypothetical protein
MSALRWLAMFRRDNCGLVSVFSFSHEWLSPMPKERESPRQKRELGNSQAHGRK